jgi:hypothetical protein
VVAVAVCGAVTQLAQVAQVVVILNGTLDSFSRANLSVTTETGTINFAADKTLINIGALSISTDRSDQTLRTGLVTNINTTSLVKAGSGTLSIAGT